MDLSLLPEVRILNRRGKQNGLLMTFLKPNPAVKRDAPPRSAAPRPLPLRWA